MTFVRLAGCNAADLGLGCIEWCDTPEGWDETLGEPMQAVDVLARVHFPRLCLTGGEPLLQLEGTAELVAAAQNGGLRVHLETNGTVDPRPAFFSTAPAVLSDLLSGADAGVVDWEDELPGGLGGVWATVSPKPPDYLVHRGWHGLVDELKLIADERLDAGTAERLAAAYPEAIVCIQPQWVEGPAAARDEAGLAVASEPGSAAEVAFQGPGLVAARRENVERAVNMVMAHPGWRLSAQTHKYLGIR